MNRRKFFKKVGVGAALTVATPVIGANLILDLERVAIEKEKQRLGVLCIPVDCIPDGMTADDVIDMWKQTGTIVYRPGKHEPHVIEAKPDFITFEKKKLDIHNILEEQDKLFKDTLR